MNKIRSSFTRLLVGVVVLSITYTGGDRFTRLAEQPFVENAATDSATPYEQRKE